VNSRENAGKPGGKWTKSGKHDEKNLEKHMETYGTKIYGGKCGKKYGKTCGETKVAKQIWKRST
jgi:hypothetical protein